MNINWKLRLQNKVTLVTLLTTFVTFVYQVLSMIGVTVPVSESEIVNAGVMLINVLAMLGIVVDPTTKGVGDTATARAYVAPREDYNFSDEDIEAEEKSLDVTINDID